MHVLDKIYCRHCGSKLGESVLGHISYLDKDSTYKSTGGKIPCSKCNEWNGFEDVVNVLESRKIEDRLYVGEIRIYCGETTV